MSYEGTYAPKLVTAQIGLPKTPLGVDVTIPGLPQSYSFPYTISGRAADGFFTKALAEDTVSMITGAEGNTQLVLNHNESGNFTITVHHGTRACRLFSLLFKAQRLIGSGQLPPFTFPVHYRDLSCTPPETHTGFNCMIMRDPDISFGASVGTVVWGFVSATIVSNLSSRV